MASAENIAYVKEQLPTGEWDDDKIGQMIDQLGSPAKAIRLYWSGKVANTSMYVDVSESSSSRSLSQEYQHALEMLRYWDAIVDREDTQENAAIASRSFSRKIKRT